MNLSAAFFVGGTWILASAIWQTFYRWARADATSGLALHLAIDVVPGVLLAFVIGNLA